MICVSHQRVRLLHLAVWLVAALRLTSAHAADIVVSAAASLTQAFTGIAHVYEAQHAGTRVSLNFGASDMLLKQIEQGAPVDVFASADEATMDRAAASGRIDSTSRRDIAGNVLVLIVPKAHALPMTLAELAGPGFTHIAVGNPDTVPAGRYARQALVAANLWDSLQPKLVQTQNVRQALDYVARGEAEAGFVYATDAAIAAKAVAIALRVPTATPVRYPAAAIGDCASKPAACDFVRFLTSPQSRATLARYGFEPIIAP
ncbi:MAG: molybdate ABC transporter substrate-binding protein [Proteobacteria bacterium]|nr:molybdate ABC transporter substrate-binding protein [Pseudomonadota bacterium]